MVANALSWKCIGSLAYITKINKLLVNELHELDVSEMKFEGKESNLLLAHVELDSFLQGYIKATKLKTPTCVRR